MEDDDRKKVCQAHFTLLKAFGRNPDMANHTKRERKQIWSTMCQVANLAVVDHDVVVEVWRDYVTGCSKRASIVVNGDVDPNLTSVGIAFDRRITAAHTMSTRSLLMRIMNIFAKTFKSKQEFASMMATMTQHASTKAFDE